MVNPGDNIRLLWNLCELKDFGPKQNETKWNFVKTESDLPRNALLNTMNFCSSSGPNLPKLSWNLTKSNNISDDNMLKYFDFVRF